MCTVCAARWKLLGQCLVVLPIVLSGCQLQHLVCCGWQIDLGSLAGPATIVWLVLGINAMNLLDGMDGMASIVAVGIAVTIAGIDFFGHTGSLTLVIVPLAGALLGFLAFNFPPARIYLGDTGSMAIGLAVSLAALLAARTDGGATNLTILGAVMAIPLADTALAVVRRSLSGYGFWHPDRGHLHHRLLDQGLRRSKFCSSFLACRWFGRRSWRLPVKGIPTASPGALPRSPWSWRCDYAWQATTNGHC